MEALLNVRPNSRKAPDYEGFEVKALTVSNFNRITSKSVTLFTPDPDSGFYLAGIVEFLRTYGYRDRRGRPDRQNFGGVHRVGQRHNLTNLLLQLTGYDSKNPNSFDSDGALELIDELDQLAAGWSFKKLISHWKKKHEKAVYVPAIKDKSVVQFQYSNKVEICYGADFFRVLDCLVTGDMCYDPAIRALYWSTRPKTKARSQFRIKASKISSLYSSSRIVDLNE